MVQFRFCQLVSSHERSATKPPFAVYRALPQPFQSASILFQRAHVRETYGYLGSSLHVQLWFSASAPSGRLKVKDVVALSPSGALQS